MDSDTLKLTVNGVPVQIAYLHRAGTRPPLVCLHGFGSTKEDYADLSLLPDFQDRELLMWDMPGCGQSDLESPDVLSIPFLVDVTLAVCDALAISQFHLSGHSMGGLTALMLANAHSERVLSFFDIEGNVAPEDCFLSRQIIDYPAQNPEAFMAGFKERVRLRSEFSSALYVSALDIKVRATTVAPIFRSMVHISDNKPLMDYMTGLPRPKAFVYGEHNRHLSYLNELKSHGIEVIEIASSGHFPMYSNPPALWAELAGFLTRQSA